MSRSTDCGLWVIPFLVVRRTAMFRGNDQAVPGLAGLLCRGQERRKHQWRDEQACRLEATNHRLIFRDGNCRFRLRVRIAGGRFCGNLPKRQRRGRLGADRGAFSTAKVEKAPLPVAV